MFLTEFTPSYSLTHNGDDAPQKVNTDFSSSVKLRFKFQLSVRTAGFGISCALKCLHGATRLAACGELKVRTVQER